MKFGFFVAFFGQLGLLRRFDRFEGSSGKFLAVADF